MIITKTDLLIIIFAALTITVFTAGLIVAIRKDSGIAGAITAIVSSVLAEITFALCLAYVKDFNPDDIAKVFAPFGIVALILGLFLNYRKLKTKEKNEQEQLKDIDSER